MVYEVGSSLEEVAIAVSSACQELERRNIPFNLLIADRGARVFLIPQVCLLSTILSLYELLTVNCVFSVLC